MNKKLIFDIGFHKGEDTKLYLKKGYKVIAVDANPFLIEKGKKIFFQEIASWKLILLNYWITKEGAWNLPFHINNTHTEWSSFDPIAGNRGNKWSSVIQVPCMSIENLFEKYGTPYYLKCDIEGNDIYVAQWLTKDVKPFYLSCELSSDNLLETLMRKWYTQFKFIDQRNAWKSWIFSPLIPSTVYEFYKKLKNYFYRSKTYLSSSSWPFWEESSWKWLNQDEAKKVFQKIKTHSSRILGPWIDIHAK